MGTRISRSLGSRRASRVKTIHDPRDAYAYANNLGFAGSGPIVYRQQALSSVVDALLKASGNESWYHKVFRPFQVRFEHYTSPEGYRFPWKGAFYVRSVVNGKWRRVDMNTVKAYGSRSRRSR